MLLRHLLLLLALGVPGVCQAAGGLPDDAPPQAVQRYTIGVELYRAEKYEAAAREFRVAFKLYPKSTKLAYNLARCLERANRYGEAVDAYREYLELAPNADDRAEVEGSIAALTEELPELVLSSQPAGATVQIDGRPVEGTTPMRVRLSPGAHLLQVAIGARQAAKTVDIVAGQNALLLELPPAAEATTATGSVEPASPPGSVWPWVAFGVGAAGVLTGVVFTVIAADEADQRDAIGEDTTAARDHHDAMNSANTLSLVGYGVGVAGVATGALLMVLDDPERSASISPAVGPGFVAVRGRF